MYCLIKLDLIEDVMHARERVVFSQRGAPHYCSGCPSPVCGHEPPWCRLPAAPTTNAAAAPTTATEAAVCDGGAEGGAQPRTAAGCVLTTQTFDY